MTGIFGAYTEQAVQVYQSKYNLVVGGTPLTTGYGLVGAKTRAILNAQSLRTTTPVAVVSPQILQIPEQNTSCILSRTLAKGMQGPDVLCLQRTLITGGFLDASNASGLFGVVTEDAVKVYQRTRNIASAGSPLTTGFGLVGFKTRQVLNAGQPKIALVIVPKPTSGGGTGGNAGSGSSGSLSGGGGGAGPAPADPDTTAPVLSSGAPGGTLAFGTTNTSVTLATDESATCRYATTTGVSYSSMAAFTTTGTTAHSLTVTSISNGATYNFYIKCSDTAGNTSSADYAVTFSVALDTTIPTVSLTAPSNGVTVGGSSVTVSATAADNAAVAGVTFYANGAALGVEDTSAPYSIVWNTTATTSGSKTLTAVVRDSSNNVATASPFTVTVDNISPVISSIATSSITASGAVISWTTNELSNSRIDYGVSTSYGSNVSSSTLTTTHLMSLTGLAAATTYHIRIQSADAIGNTATSSDVVFTTSVGADVAPPTVSLTAPTNGATVSGLTTITATASDTVAVAGVTFKLDGTVVIGSEDTTAPYSIAWNSASTTDGSHTLSAIARDTSNNLATSTVSVTVANIGTSTGLGSFAYSFGRVSLVNAPVATVTPSVNPSACSITSGNGSGYFAVNSACRLTLASAGVGNITGSYTLGLSVTGATTSGIATVTVNTLADRYDVDTIADLTTILATTTAILSGKTIALHEGNYGTVLVNKPGLTSTFTLKNAEPVKPIISDMVLTSMSNMTIDGLAFQMNAWPKSVTNILRITGTTTAVTIRNSTFRHGCDALHTECDPTKNDYPEYTAATGSRMVDKLANGIGTDGGTHIYDLVIEDNIFSDLYTGMGIGVQGGNILINRNVITRIYNDFMEVAINQARPDSTIVSWNVMSLPFGKSTDLNGPHCDFMQMWGNYTVPPTTPVDWTNIVIEGNVAFTGMYNGVSTRGDAQGIPFADDMPTGKFYSGPTIRGNVTLSRSSSHGSDVSGAKEVYMFGNTFVHSDPADPVNLAAMLINVGGLESSGNHAILNNVTESIALNAGVIDSGNVKLGLNGGSIPYATAFTGPTFAPASVAEVISKFSPKAGGPLASSTSVIGAIGNGYVDFINHTIDHTMEPSFVYFVPLVNQATSSLVTSNISLARGGVTARSISIGGSGSPQYRVCADETCTSVTTDWTASSATISAGSYVQMRVTTPGISSQTNNATLTIGSQNFVFSVTTTASVTFTTVTFDGTTPDYMRTVIGLNASTTPTGIATTSANAVTNVTITNGGSGFEPGTQNTLTFSGGGGTGAAGYATDANGDGVLDSVTITAGGSGYTGVPAVSFTRKIQRFVVAMRVKPAAVTSNDAYINGGGAFMSVNVATPASAGSIILVNTGTINVTTLGGLSTTTMKTMICSVDLSQTFANGFKCYLEGASVAPGSASTWTQGNTLNYSTVGVGVAAVAIAANSAGSGAYWEGGMDFIYYAFGLAALDTATGQLLDISSSTVRNRFTADNINVNDGSGPTGRRPQLFFTGAPAIWNAATNKGSATGFTTTGAVN